MFRNEEVYIIEKNAFILKFLGFFRTNPEKFIIFKKNI